jgi:hypothetical protein
MSVAEVVFRFENHASIGTAVHHGNHGRFKTKVANAIPFLHGRLRI